MPGSRVSVSSQKKNKSEVDESLFGASKKKNEAQTQKIVESVRKGNVANPEVVLIGESELQRMKNNAIITTKEEQLYQKKLLEEQKEKQMAA
ncbi:hypothetical protein pb186bvf_020700, partial [Paramecium bursaria]